jgi:hypothetical protein
LDLPDVFDGKVTPNDFPVKVYLKEKWKGKCGAKGRKKWRACVGARETLVDACEGEGKDKGDWCTYSSLVLEKQRLEKAKIKLSFKGKCDSTAGDVHWCKFETLQEQQMEACLGKHVGKSCEYSTNGKGYSDLFTGLCTGGSGGSHSGVKVFQRLRSMHAKVMFAAIIVRWKVPSLGKVCAAMDTRTCNVSVGKRAPLRHQKSRCQNLQSEEEAGARP